MAEIKGTALDDVLQTGAGIDTVLGLAGNDVILVAAPADLPVGEKLDGGAGVDRVWFTGGGTLALVAGGIESAQVTDTAGNNSAAGAANLDASALKAVSTGFTLAGNAGVNLLTGTSGKDLIIGGGGADTIVAGAGADRVVMSIVAADADAADGGALTELNTLALVGAATALVVVDLGDDVDQMTGVALVQRGFARLDAAGVTGTFGVQVSGGTQKNIIFGSGQADFFHFETTADLAGDTVSGGAGNDVLRYTSAVDANVLALSAAISVEAAEVADDTGATTGTAKLGINAAAVLKAIKLTGNDGANALTGSKFDDTLVGNDGADTLDGGDGNDSYDVAIGADFTALDVIKDAKGTDDRIAFSDTQDGATLLLNAKVTGIEAVYLSGLDFDLAGTADLNVNGAALAAGIALRGNAGVNSLTGGKGNDTIAGGGGADVIAGGLGADRIEFDIDSAAVVDAGAAVQGNILALTGTLTGLVSIDLGVGVDTVGTDQFLSDGAAQQGFAHVDASELEGGAGGVSVTGSSLANRITGSGLDDVIVYGLAAHATNDTVDGGEGNDAVRFAAAAADKLLVVSAKWLGLERIEIADAAGDNSGLLGLGINAAASAAAIELRGNFGNNSLAGSKFGDTLFGALGADTLSGGVGDDTYLYEAGAEFLAGEKISDTGGLDSVKFASTMGGDMLVMSDVKGVEKYGFDEEGATDIGIDISLVTTAAEMLGNDANNTLVGSNVTKTGDTMIGGLGDDLLDGGKGNDRLEGGEGRDTIIGGAGNDVIVMSIVAVDADDIDAGSGSTERNILSLVGEATPLDTLLIDLTVAPGNDQTNAAGPQTGIFQVDASGVTGAFEDWFGGPVVTVIGRDNAVGDFIVGSPGPDRFIPGAGNDTIEGGGGNDIIEIYEASDIGNDRYLDNGGSGADYIFYFGTGGTLTLKDENIAGFDVVACGGSADISIDASKMLQSIGLGGNSGDNTLKGSAAGGTIFDFGDFSGDTGSDLLNGGVGFNDYVIVGDWTVAAPGVTGDRIVDKGVDNHFYLASDAQVLVIDPTKIPVSVFSLFAVSGGDVNVHGVGTYIRDVAVFNNAGIDAQAVGHTIHLAGSYGDNFLRGTNAADTIIGWLGQDTIFGGGGADHITMDVGISDNLDSEFSSDGSPDWDQIDAGAMSEGNRWILTGGPTGTVVIDLTALDQLVSINGAIEGLSQSGFQHVNASALKLPAVTLDGANYGVYITGTAGLNEITGTNEDDILAGNGGADTLAGGAGNDIFVVLSEGHYNAASGYHGGGDEDIVLFAATGVSTSAGANILDLGAAKSNDIEGATIGVITLGAVDTSGTTALGLNASGMENSMVLVGNDGDNTITGTAVADTLQGNGGADSLMGGRGNDHYVAVDGADVVAGDRIDDSGGDEDRFVFASETDGDVLVLTANMTGLELVEMHDGEDTLAGLTLEVDISALPNGVVFTGNKYANTMAGSAFADTIDGGLGIDSIDAGAGADVITMRVEATDADNVNGGLSAAEGNTLVLVGDPGADLEFDLTSGTNQLVSGIAGITITNITSIDLSGLEGDWAVTINGTAVASVTGPNAMIGTAKDDVFILSRTLAPGEVIDGGLGDDVIRFQPAAPAVLALSGLVTGIETVELEAGSADLGLTAGQVGNALKIVGNDGENAITATAHADTVEGGAGADTIFGLAGSDLITVDAAADDEVNGGAISATEANTLAFTGTAAAPLVYNLSITTGDQSSSIAGNQSGFTHVDTRGLTGSVTLTGSALANQIGINVAETAAADGGLGLDLLLLGGTAGGTITVDLSAVGDQTSVAGVQTGFEGVDASQLSGAGIDVTGSAGADQITGSAQADTIAGGLGADTVVVDVEGAADVIDAGGLGEGNRVRLTGEITAAYDVDLRVVADQFLDMTGNQTGFQHVDASALTGTFGVNVIGNGLNNELVGTLKGDTLAGGAGADTFILGGGEDGDATQDRVMMMGAADGIGAAGAVSSFDRIKDFVAGQDKLIFSGDFKGAAGLNNLDDIGTANNSLAWATDIKANFGGEHEAMLITAAKAGLKNELALTGSSFATVAKAINKKGLGVTAGAGDDGLILVQMGADTAAVQRTGIYYYLESDGIANMVSAGELTLLGIVETKIAAADVLLV